MKRLCSKCARPLKESTAMVKGKPAVVLVCKSPICARYGRPQ